MKLIILGSGGVCPPPRPGCGCRLCSGSDDPKDYRTGPSMFLPGPSVLFDTPEEIRQQILSNGIRDIHSIILTHWHPDHTLGLRIIEQMNYDYFSKKAAADPINLYMSKKQLDRFRKFSCGSFLDVYSHRGLIDLKIIEADRDIIIGSTTIIPREIKKTDGFYFEIHDGKKLVVYVPCEYHGLKVHPKTRDVDLLISHQLYFEGSDISFEGSEDSFEKMLSDAAEMSAKKIITMHIEEMFGMTHSEFRSHFKKNYPNVLIEPSYDGMLIDLN